MSIRMWSGGVGGGGDGDDDGRKVLEEVMSFEGV